MLFCCVRAYPVYTVGETTTLYSAGQGQYYAATNAGASATPGTVGYSTTSGHYVVQQAVDPDTLIASTRNSPQTTNAVRFCNRITFVCIQNGTSVERKPHNTCDFYLVRLCLNLVLFFFFLLTGRRNRAM